MIIYNNQKRPSTHLLTDLRYCASEQEVFEEGHSSVETATH